MVISYSLYIKLGKIKRGVSVKQGLFPYRKLTIQCRDLKYQELWMGKAGMALEVAIYKNRKIEQVSQVFYYTSCL